MRIAVIADIHGNCIALDAVLEEIRKEAVDHIVCLGDAIQGGPQPAAVAQRLRELRCPVVMGNADAWLLSGRETGSEPIPAERRRKMEDIRQWSLGQLSPEDLAFVSLFEPSVEVWLEDGRRLVCFHGSPASYDDFIFPHTPEDEFQRLLSSHAGHFLCGGHTHLPHVRRLGDTFFFNPGSVGVAYSHQQTADNFRADHWAEYAVFRATAEGRIGLEFRRTPFDVAALVGHYRASGRPFGDEAADQYRPRKQ